MDQDTTLQIDELMDAFNHGDPWSVFELYVSFWPDVQQILMVSLNDPDIRDNIAFTAYLQFLSIDYNQWTYADAKASFFKATNDLAASWKAWDKAAPFPWITNNIIRIGKSVPKQDIMLIFRNLEYQSYMSLIYQNIKMVLLDHELIGKPPDWSADLGLNKTHLFLAYLWIFPKVDY